MAATRLEDKALVLRNGDDVAVAREQLPAGMELDCGGMPLHLRRAIPPGHKVALRAVAAGRPVRKYGQTIGLATQDIRPGDWVHTHNLHVGPLAQDYEFGTEVVLPPPPEEERTFEGYARPDGRAGTRNYIAVVAGSNCAADTARILADCLNREALPDFCNVDGAFAITHALGCGMAIHGAEHRLLQRCLSGIVDHPNVAGAIIVGLGCEVNQAAEMARERQLIPARDLTGPRRQPPAILTIQHEGGVRRTVEAGFQQALRLLKRADEFRRTPQPLARLIVATNCGGSDGYSGITANPSLGAAGDEMVRHGAAWAMGETPETYGAEQLLTRRAVSREVGEQLVALMRWWEQYTARHGAEIDNNPAPGNKEGGLTTIYEKSLGAVMKAGSTPLAAVYQYAERITGPGLCFMDTPGHDPTSVTGLVAGGCNLVAFTTGRGSCLGFKPAPVLKIATTTELYERMPEDMDVDAGAVLRGATIAEMGRCIFDELIRIASGKKTKSELQGLGDHTFAPWTLGPVL